MRSLARRRGSALILAILVILVLTVVGVGVAYFTQVEDQTSGNVRLSKSAFYGAETGLRTGELALNGAMASVIAVNSLLSYSGSSASITLPNPGGGTAVPLRVSGTEWQNILVRDNVSLSGRTDLAAYSLYIRNNLEDPGGPTVDTDNRVNLVAVGLAVLTTGTPPAQTIERVLTTKILEEQILLSTSGTEAGAQKGLNTGGTGAGVKGTRT